MAGSNPSEIRRARPGGGTAPAKRWMPAISGMTNRPVLRWGLALLLAVGFKAFYSQAETSQLQWLLWPLASLLNGIGTLAFVPTASGEWLDAGHGLVIVKACAGGNFLIASWLGYLWRWRERNFGPAMVFKAFAAAWLTTLVANALRILLIAHGQNDFAQLTGLSAADSHRLIGIIVYFGVLSLQLVGAGTLMIASTLYLGITVLVPWLNALLSGRGGIDVEAAVWTAAIPLAAMLSYGVWRLVQHAAKARRPSMKRDTA
jgi:exosortase K